MSRHAIVTPAGAEALRILNEQTTPISRAALASALGKSRTNTAEIVQRLIDSGHVREVPRAVARGNYAPLIEIVKRVESAPPPPKPRTRVVFAPPRNSGPLPLPALSIPPAFATHRGIRHPLPPQPYAPARGESESRWTYLTTIKVPQYE